MSGDLQDPAKSIPIGTIVSAVSTIGIYGGLVVLLGATCTTDALLNNYFIMLVHTFTYFTCSKNRMLPIMVDILYLQVFSALYYRVLLQLLLEEQE